MNLYFILNTIVALTIFEVLRFIFFANAKKYACKRLRERCESLRTSTDDEIEEILRRLYE